MRALLAALTMLTLASPAYAQEDSAPADAAKAAEPAEAPTESAAVDPNNPPDIMDWYQEQRRSTVERTLRDEKTYRDRWVDHVKERYNVTITNPENNTVSADDAKPSDENEFEVQPKMDAIPSPSVIENAAAVAEAVAAEEQASTDPAAQNEPPQESWPSEQTKE